MSTNAALRILHLEDDGKDAELVQGVLESGGIACDVTRVDTREDFAAALERGGHDLILADFSLPSFDGMSALRLAVEKRPELPFIFVSGTLGEEVAIEAVKIGATDYVLKERLSRIITSVRRALREARERAERKHAVEQLRLSEAFLAEAQRISLTGSWAWVLSSGKVTWSEQQFRMLGFQPGRAEPSLELFISALHPEDRERVRRELEEATSARRPYEINYRIVLPEGTRYFSSVGRPVPGAGGAIDEYIGTTTDVTERVRAQAALLARQEMLDLAQKAAQAVAFEWKIGAGNDVNRWSPELEAMYGLCAGSCDGSFEAWKKLVHPEDWPAVEQAIEHARLSGEFLAEYRVSHGGAPVRWLQARGRMFFDDAGGPARMVGFVQDVTQRKQAEEELKTLERRLRRVEHLESLGTLAGGIAHDFNNILGAILGYGEMALRDAAPGTRLRRDLDNILAAGERGRALIERVLAFSQSGAAERAPVHVEEVVREALDLLAGGLPPNVRIEVELQAGRAAMLGDPTQVHQVVMNLASNAVQAMPNGGVLRVSLHCARFDEPREAAIGSLSAGEYLVLRVSDTGTGIDDEVLERMFDPFFTTKEVGVGSGLGLSLVHGIANSVGGAIDVATELGRGSTFTVYLPRSGDAREQKVDEDGPLPRGDGQRVLIVDDEEPLVRLASETLEELGYAPVGFTSSLSALREFGANPEGFDAILTDERMPGITGSTIIGEVRRMNQSIPILLMTGYLGAATALKARELGANEVLKKPLLARDLATSLARALQL